MACLVGRSFPQSSNPPPSGMQGGKSPVFGFVLKERKSAKGARQAKRVRPVGLPPVVKEAPEWVHVGNP